MTEEYGIGSLAALIAFSHRCNEETRQELAEANNGTVDYLTYIKSDAWREKANAAKERAGWRCQVCNVEGNAYSLNAHHRTYERLGDERPGDITVLCRACHEMYSTKHRRRKSCSTLTVF
jgi:hypothetical protein